MTDTRSVDDIVADMDKLLVDAGDADLTDEQVNRYEAFEKELQTRKSTSEVQKRHAAYKAVTTSAIVTGAQAKGDDTLDRAFNHYLRTGQTNADLVELRAQGEVSGTAGGFLVPDTFRNKLVDRMKAFGGISAVAEQFTTGDGTPVNWPTLDDTSNLGEIVSEGGTFSAGADMVFGEANLGAYKYMSGGAGATPLRVSVELLQDAAFDVEGLISRKLGERIARVQAQHLVTGTGVAQPLGISTGLTGIQTAANNALTYADLLKFVHAVDPAYRARARWAFNDQSLAAIQGLLDLNGRPILQPAATGGASTDPAGDVLLGYPVTIDQAFPTFTNNSPTVNWGVFGDLSEGYVIRRVRDVQIIVDPYTRAANGQVCFTAWARMDATQQNTAAYVALTGKT